MKKTVVTLMIVAVVFMLAGCSTPTETVVEIPEVTESTVTEGEAATILFGKVKSIVGNEIEIEVAEQPFDAESAESGEAGDSSSSEYREFTYEVSEGEELPEGLEGLEGESSSSTATVIAVEGSDGEMKIIGGGSEEKMELNYTGESKNIIIPAGTEIANLIGGSSTLEDIKKGSVLMLGIDDENAETPKAMNVIIME